MGGGGKTKWVVMENLVIIIENSHGVVSVQRRSFEFIKSDVSELFSKNYQYYLTVKFNTNFMVLFLFFVIFLNIF